VKTFGRFSSHRRFEHQKNISAALVIILSLAAFDHVKAEGLAESAEPDARNAPDLAARPRLRLTRSEIAIHEFGRHRHHDQSKNPAHHTTGSKLAPRRAVLKFDLDAIHRSIMQTDGVSLDDISRCSLSSLTGLGFLARAHARRMVRLVVRVPIMRRLGLAFFLTS
jgi:hypothetical protein